MTEDELANFFMFLRENKKFVNIGEGEKYCDDVKDEFYGAFWMEKKGSGRYIIYFNDAEGEFQNVGPLHENDLKWFLMNERKINDQIMALKMMEKDLVTDLNAIARECDGVANKINVLNTHNTILKLEMATNHFDYFEEYVNSL